MASKLEQLIQELCPDGVEYRFLNGIAEYGRMRIEANSVNAQTYVGVDNLLPDKMGKTESTYVPNEGRLSAYVKNDILIGNIRPYLKKIWLADCDGGTNGDVLVIHITDKMIEPKFLYYCLSSDKFFLYDMQHAKGAKMPRGDKQAVMEFKVPVPPLEVQREIVRVLDNFTSITEELSTKLSAELSARRKQYEYYRDSLLIFTDTLVQKIEVGELFDFKNGINKEKSAFGSGSPIVNFTNVYNKNKLYIEDLQGRVQVSDEEVERYSARKGDVFFTRTSETQEDIGITSVLLDDIERCVFSGFVLRARPKTELLLPEYCAYCFASDEVRKYIVRHSTYTTRALTNGGTLSRIVLSVPPKEDQRRIVASLDRFEGICNDLKTALPAEINARHKQYEYYRDRLLSFKEYSGTKNG